MSEWVARLGGWVGGWVGGGWMDEWACLPALDEELRDVDLLVGAAVAIGHDKAGEHEDEGKGRVA